MGKKTVTEYFSKKRSSVSKEAATPPSFYIAEEPIQPVKGKKTKREEPVLPAKGKKTKREEPVLLAKGKKTKQEEPFNEQFSIKVRPVFPP